MSYLKTHATAIPLAVAAVLLSATAATAQIAGLCNTGQTAKTPAGCSGELVTPNPPGGGVNRDGNWALAFPYPSSSSGITDACKEKLFIPAWVDTPQVEWLPNSASTFSEWITPYDGEGNRAPGWYVYATSFPVPSVLPHGFLPRGVMINGRLASDNATYLIYMESPADSLKCTLVAGQPFPVNPSGNGNSDFQQWWPFSFRNKLELTPGEDAYLYFVVQNSSTGDSPTGFRAEFFNSSTFY